MENEKIEYDPEWILATLNDAKEALENLIGYIEDDPEDAKAILDEQIPSVYAKLNYAYNSAKEGPDALMSLEDDDLVAFPHILPFKHSSTEFSKE